MLELDYSKRLDSLIQSLDWQIQLPPFWSTFFKDVGETSTLQNDERQNRRMKVRTLAVLHYERSLPSMPRPDQPIGVYIKDFTRRSCGFISANQLFPEEIVRIILPTFWIRLHLVRARRVGPSCYEYGGELLEQNQPSDLAFKGISMPDPLLLA